MPREHETRSGRHTSTSGEYSRKDKSLGLLCENFVAAYGRDTNHEICLDAAAVALGVERRRIYDIVNVLESVGIVTRKAKNCYTWKGFAQIPGKLNDLRHKAFSDLYGTPEDFRTPSNTARKAAKKGASPIKLEPSQQTSYSPRNSSTTPGSLETEPDLEQKPQPRQGSRKEKSLGVLSQRFVQLFLLAGDKAVSLDQAAVQLLGRSPSDTDPLSISPAEGDASKLLKTKVRRLYDIANILSSLRLIEKVHTSNRKPAFKWLGPSDGMSNYQFVQSDSLKRAASEDFEKTNTPNKRRKSFTPSTCGNETTLVGVTEHPSPVTEATEPSVVCEGFDAQTLARIDAIVQTFPPAFARRWRDYVNDVQTMLLEGKITRETAYDSVSRVLSLSKATEKGSPSGKERVSTSGDEKKNITSSEVTANAKQPSVSTSTPNTPERPKSEQEIGHETGNEPVASSKVPDLQMENTSIGRDSSSVHGFPVGFNMPMDMTKAMAMASMWSPDCIDDYMRRARAAGPPYEAAAEAWLKNYHAWYKSWGGNMGMAAMTAMQFPSARTQPAENVATLSKHS